MNYDSSIFDEKLPFSSETSDPNRVMKYSIHVFLLATFVWPASKSQICRTSDAIIVEGLTEFLEPSSSESPDGQFSPAETITDSNPVLIPDEKIPSCNARSIDNSPLDSGLTFGSLTGLIKNVSVDPATRLLQPNLPRRLHIILRPNNLTKFSPEKRRPAIRLPRNCGAGPYKTLSIDEQRRIVGGMDAVKNSWPSVVALLNNDRPFCGGSLMDSRHIITAAHCVAHLSSWDVSRLTVALGIHTLNPTQDPQIVKKVRRVTRHKRFNATTFHNDVAILTMESPVVFTRTISPVCLPVGTNDKFTGKNAVVIGWGAMNQGGHQSNVLQQMTVKIITNQECKKKYGRNAPGGIADHMLCAAYPGRDSSSGDSGGPMLFQNTPGSPWIQVGIVSWGIGGAPNYPSVYIRITSFMEWIAKYLNK